MTDITWRDDTSYRRGEKNRVPRVLSTGVGPDRITVHHHIHCSDDIWFLSCHSLGIDLFELESRDLEDAKKEALQSIYDRVNNLRERLKPVIEKMKEEQ